MMALTGPRCVNKLILRTNSRRLAAICTGKRGISTSEAAPRHCWKCGSVLCEGCTLFCSTPTCEAIQGLDKENTNYFSLFGMKETFNVDDSQLDVSFKNLQRQLHPDKFAMKSVEERERSTYNSSIVNQAYQLLKSPVDRIAYLLSFHNLDILEEGKTFSEPALMKEMFELSERAEDADTQEEVAALYGEVDGAAKGVQDSIQSYFDQSDFNMVGRAAVRLKYLTNVKETLKARISTD